MHESILDAAKKIKQLEIQGARNVAIAAIKSIKKSALKSKAKNKAALIENIAELVKNKKIDGISDLRDESDRQGMRIVIELKRETQPQAVLNNLFKYTSMQSSFFVNMLALVDGQPRVISLKEALQHYIDFRRQVITRRSKYELKQARARAHILEGLRIVTIKS